jgi:hypothetical protein
MLVRELVLDVCLSYQWAAILYEEMVILPQIKQKKIVFAANNSPCCECHIAPTINLCSGLVTPTIF